METSEKIRLLKSLKFLDHLKDDQLQSLAGVLKLVLLESGATVFEEGSPGDSLYFLTSGEVRIRKRSPDGSSAELSVLGPGDSFGEMALLTADVARSAGAVVSKDCVLFGLAKSDLKGWLDAQPGLAVEFFNGIVQLQSARLRRTSQEASLLFDLSRLLIGRPRLSEELLAHVLDQLIWYLEGQWWGGALMLADQSGSAKLVAERGEKPAPPKGKKAPSCEPAAERRSGWTDVYTYQAFLPEGPQSAACLMLRTPEAVPEARRQEIDRFMGKAARLLSLVAEKPAAA